jgi:rsbT co-antagonist protein RsbR
MDLSDQEISRRKEFLEFGEEDVKVLKGLNEFAQMHADSVVEDFYKHLLSYEETRASFQDPATLVHFKQLQKEYFLGLTQGSYGADYVANRIKVGIVHRRIKVDLKWYLGSYNFYLQGVMGRLFESFAREPKKAVAGLQSLMKVVFLDISLAIQTYVRTIQQQQEAIRELSTPVLQVRRRLLMLPIVGVIDSQRAKQLTDSLLRAIRANRAKVVVMDITGVGAVDSKVANHLIQTVAAARLMGTAVIVTGLSAEVARALVGLGVDLTKLNTVGDLQGGLEEAERMLGFKAVSLDESPSRVAPAQGGDRRDADESGATGRETRSPGRGA